MLEFRYVTRTETVKEYGPGYGGKPEEVTRVRTVLQYRTGGHYPCKINLEWSEWTDVLYVEHEA